MKKSILLLQNPDTLTIFMCGVYIHPGIVYETKFSSFGFKYLNSISVESSQNARPKAATFSRIYIRNPLCVYHAYLIYFESIHLLYNIFQ